jgi:integrase/recombinase XerD
MLTAYFKSAPTLARYRSVLAGPYLDEFISWLANRGYQRVSIRRHVREVVHFAAWAASESLALRELDHRALVRLHDHLNDHGRLLPLSGNHRQLYQSACVFTRFLGTIGVVRSVKQHSQSCVPALYSEFCEWMNAQRGTLDVTLASYLLPVTNLLRALGEPSTYTAQRLRAFFLQQINQAHPGTAKHTATALRMFLRFLVARGNCVAGLDFAIPTVARWRLSSLPKYIPTSAVDDLIASCDQSTPLGARDRAMLLLIARLGLRASDVSGLQFRDLSWPRSRLIVAGKNRRKTELPLPEDVGDAILHYLQHGRPEATTEYVFMTVLAPIMPITRQTVGKAVARAIRRTGIAAPSRGTHLLRHSVATSMLREGISLSAIGVLLRHASIETTAVYAKVDTDLLQEVAMPWPGVEPC